MLECPSVSYSPIHPAARVGTRWAVALRFLCSCALARKCEPTGCMHPWPWPCALSRATCNARVLALPSGNIGLSRTTRL